MIAAVPVLGGLLLLWAGALLPAQPVPELSGRSRKPPASRREASPSFRATTSLVMVPVGVRDRQGRVVDDLTAADFALFDNGVRQTLVQCVLEEGPRETVVVFDQSESMRPELAAVHEGVRAFVKEASPGDKISVITVRDSADVGVAPTGDTDQVLRSLGPVVAEGRTALFDGVYLGLDRILKARAPRGALLILSDGGDNSSRYQPHELRNLAIEAGAAIHSIVTAPGFPLSPESQGQVTMKRLAEETGGWHWTARHRGDIPGLVRRLQRDPQYVLAYRPGVLDGRHHRIEVKVKRGSRGLRLTWRRSFAADGLLVH